MAKIKTNSNSITSIFTVALNQESDFQTKVLELIEKRIKRKIPSDVIFYECTHSPLLYKEMKGKEIDIIARVPGKHKPVMMIEIKANIDEVLQPSQKNKGEYQKTSEVHGIPLIYIIPKAYSHRDELPKTAKIIEWEEILETSENISISFDTQIYQFVELSYTDETITEEEKKLFSDKNLLTKIYKLKTDVLNSIYEIINDKYKRKIDKSEEEEWGVGAYYHFKGENYFLGFNPYYSEIENGNYFLALDIAESCKNAKLEDEKVLYFDEGYYYLPVLNEKAEYGDTKVILELRKNLEELKITNISKDIRDNFASFYSLRNKIGEDLFDSIFKNSEDAIDERVYEKIMKTKIMRKMLK